MRLIPLYFLCAVGTALPPAAALAAGTDDEAALQLADATPEVAERASAWRIFTEASLARQRVRYGADDFNTARLSLDVYYDGVIAPGWRAIFGDRVDRHYQSGPAQNDTVNTLREAYVSWHPEGNNIIDVGRVNVRYGVAYGYNPTDYFRANAIRSVVSIDPNSLRENRLGTVMVRGQTLFSGGSLTAILAPRLENRSNDAPFSPDFGATNNRTRYMLAASKQFSENFNPQVLVFGGAGQAPQVGANLSVLLNPATVGYAEWSAGRSRSLYDQAVGPDGDKGVHQKLASGLTFTTANKMSLTAEYQYNGAAVSGKAWKALGATQIGNYFTYRADIQNALESPTRNALFFYGSWQDALVSHLDLKAFVRYNLTDQSRLNWIEARYHFTRADLTLQAQHNGGNAFSEYGALPQRQMIQTMLTYYF